MKLISSCSFFWKEIADYHIWKNCRSVTLKLQTLSCGLLRNIVFAELQIAVADKHFIKKLQNYDCKSVEFGLRTWKR